MTMITDEEERATVRQIQLHPDQPISVAREVMKRLWALDFDSLAIPSNSQFLDRNPSFGRRTSSSSRIARTH
jgi:hypothetical protein